MDNHKRKRRFIVFLWTAFTLPILTIFIIFILIFNGKFGYMPSFEELENPNFNIASDLIADDSTLIGKYFYENRSLVEFEDLSPNLINALLCTEDIRYFKHSGIDFRGVVRAIVKSVILGDESSGGGSTISQQLAKLLYTDRSRNKLERIFQKFNEWVIAVKLEKRYTKEEIIAMYLNYFDFLYNSIGIDSASKVYFSTTPDSLKTEQAAVLVGMLKNPSLFNPLRFPDKAQGRRNIVLNQMRRYGKITREEYDSLAYLPLEVFYTPADYSDGIARYFYDNIRLTLTAKKPQRSNYYTYHQFKIDSIRWYTDPFYGWCNKNFRPDGTPYNIYTDGLKIYSTLNYQYQLFAEEAVREHLGNDLQVAFFNEKKGRSYAPFSKNLNQEEIQSIMNSAIMRSERYRVLKKAGKSNNEIKEIFRKPVPMKVFSWEGMKDTVMAPIDSIKYYKHFLRTGFISMEPNTGHVKAYIGGIDFKQFKFDHATATNRQVGSTIKPFLYTLAMREGYTPCHQVPNVPVSFPVGDSTWTPKNSGYHQWENQLVTLKFGLSRSINWITAWVLAQFNPEQVVDMAHKLGIKSYIDPVYSVILGTSGMSVEEVVNAYCVYANKGLHVDPVYVTRIEDKNGNVLSTFQAKPTEVISEKTAFQMIELLKGVVNQGTANRLRWKYNFEIPIAGKTGTTQNHSDGWFIGATPKLVSGVWVGCEDRAAHFDDIGLGQGANMALPIWALYMQKVVAADSTFQASEFEWSEEYDIEIDCDDANDPALNSREEIFEFNIF
jgi:penicillin-binding protein 1A